MRRIILILLLASVSSAEYKPEKLISFEWGKGANQLEFIPSVRESLYIDEEKRWEYEVTPIFGPKEGFVDKDDNIFINTKEIGKFTGFDKFGDVIVNYSSWEKGLNRDLFGTYVSEFYVDSHDQIYIIGFEDTNFVAVADFNNNLINRLHPNGLNSGVPLDFLYRNSDDIITFKTVTGYYTYKNGTFKAGGSSSWMAKDSNYYDCILEGSDTLVFVRFQNPDISGKSENLKSFVFTLDREYMEAKLLGISDDMRIFIYLRDKQNQRFVGIFNDAFNLIDQFKISPIDNIYNTGILPFLRYDGVLFDFAMDKDGLHVIRWSRK